MPYRSMDNGVGTKERIPKMLTPVIRMFVIASLFALGCSQGEAPAPINDNTETTKTEKKESPKPSIKTGKGVDAAKKLIKIGTLNAESGPAATAVFGTTRSEAAEPSGPPGSRSWT